MSTSLLSQDEPWHISVLVPARNEEQLLPRCLQSILDARAALPPSISCRIVVVVDRSTDATLPIARRMLRGIGTVAQTEVGVVGHARALAASLALDCCQVSATRHWLANTDADCIVPRDWLVDQLAIAETGVEAIAGVIDVDSFEEHAPHVVGRFRATYLTNADGSHSHVHGANIGMRADAYLRVGGWEDFATAEDHDLWKRLLSVNVRAISTTRIHVLTSGRRVGRAPHGFADALAAHNESAA